ncbi:MAG TPA: SRPBCC domain-containing protein [Xanthobacteraceae bacterium]|nr:SRPBCC domain-containing protein [Xanthobacteraceae bacterium]
MSASDASRRISSGHTVIEEVTIQASAERVFAALTDPQQRVHWWGVEGRFQATHMESDLRPGGRWVTRGTAWGGRPFTVVGEYRVVEPPRALAFTWKADWDPDAPESLVRFDLSEHEGVTTVRLTHSGLTPASRERHKGWPEILGRLKACLEGPSPTAA